MKRDSSIGIGLRSGICFVCRLRPKNSSNSQMEEKESHPDRQRMSELVLQLASKSATPIEEVLTPFALESLPLFHSPQQLRLLKQKKLELKKWKMPLPHHHMQEEAPPPPRSSEQLILILPSASKSVEERSILPCPLYSSDRSTFIECDRSGIDQLQLLNFLTPILVLKEHPLLTLNPKAFPADTGLVRSSIYRSRRRWTYQLLNSQHQLNKRA